MNLDEAMEALEMLCACMTSSSQEIDVLNESPEELCEDHNAWERYRRATELAECALCTFPPVAVVCPAVSASIQRGALTRRWAAATGE